MTFNVKCKGCEVAYLSCHFSVTVITRVDLMSFEGPLVVHEVLYLISTEVNSMHL